MKKITLLLFIILCIAEVNGQDRYILTSDSVNLFVRVKGKGTPCLYIHGGPGSGSYWLEKFMGDFFEEQFQMIYLDQRGVGRSSSPKDNNYSMERMVKDFEEIRKALGIHQWITLGHSFGGILEMGYANTYHAVIKGMLMFNCTLNMTESFSKSWIPSACDLLELPANSIYRNDSIRLLDRVMGVIGQLNQRNLLWKMAFSNEENNKIMDATYDEIPNWNYSLGGQGLSIAEYWNNYKTNCPNLTMPVLFFSGNHDLIIGPTHYLDVKFPNMMLFKSDAGHIPFMENKEDVIKAIQEYKKKYTL